VRPWLLLGICLGLAIPLQASGITVTVTPEGPNLYGITLETALTAPPPAVWSVLTDYDHHAKILPYMSESRILKPAPLTVKQVGSIKILFWTYHMEVTQEIIQTPPREMRFHAIAGDFKRLEGVWRLVPADKETALRCDFLVEPKKRVPLWAVRLAAKHYLAKMMKTLAEHAR
jgi:ribosome-associated toxin RatA of RatAB toxin-antitoxin module